LWQSGSSSIPPSRDPYQEVGFEEISIDFLQARFLDKFRVADNPGGTLFFDTATLDGTNRLAVPFLHVAGSFLHSAWDSMSKASMGNGMMKMCGNGSASSLR
jgi:hypothetical protein